MMDKDRLCLHTIWLRDEAYQRLNRLADRLDISKSEVVMAALKLYEEQMLAVEAEGFDVSNGRKPRTLVQTIAARYGAKEYPYFNMVEIEKAEAEVAAINLGTVGPDFDKPMSRDKIEEIFEGKDLYLD